jgi:pimeloyl-ACP methyl ester carboxylesterase
MTTSIAPTAHPLNVPGATLAYDVRPAESASPPLLLIGSPMGAGGFATLASHFTDRTVVTYDPRGVERSAKDDPATPSTPEQHADDLHRLIDELGGGPIDLFASSGGAVNALALVAAHPEQVRVLVAHEPPLAAILPDREGALAACRAVGDAYQDAGFGAGMARFIAVVGHRGPFDPADAALPGPDPAMFGLPSEDDGNRTDPLLFQNLITCTHYEPNFTALRAAATRIVLGAGAESEGQLAHRGALALAEGLGLEAVMFPSDHGGFLGGEYGQRGDPDGFAATLRGVLAEPGV